jgi:hypothetical protein
VFLRRGVSAPTEDGAMLIRAVVDARLFGLRLLTLDARVVVAEADPSESVLDAVVEIDPTVMPLARTRAAAGVRATGHGTDRGVRHARELLAQGTDTLAGLRRSGSA